jgi:hypothetical protein
VSLVRHSNGLVDYLVELRASLTLGHNHVQYILSEGSPNSAKAGQDKMLFKLMILGLAAFAALCNAVKLDAPAVSTPSTHGVILHVRPRSCPWPILVSVRELAP